MKKRTDVKPATSPLPIVDGRPLIDRTEQARTDASLRVYTLTECERQAYIEKYGAPTQPLKSAGGR